jgi:hypothetical protein
MEPLVGTESLCGLGCVKLGEVGLVYGMFGCVRWGWLRWGGLDNVEGLLKTVDVFDISISEGYAHLEVKICKERMWKLRVCRYGLHFPILSDQCSCISPVRITLSNLVWSVFKCISPVQITLSNLVWSVFKCISPNLMLIRNAVHFCGIGTICDTLKTLYWNIESMKYARSTRDSKTL